MQWSDRSRSCALVALIGGVLLLAEFLLFDQIGARHHTWVYPRWNDQIQYLTESYLGYMDAQTSGLGAGLWHALTNRSAQGTLHDVWALLVFSIAGPSRSAALSLNILLLIAWQVAAFAWASRAFRSAWVGLIAAALPLVLRSPWLVVPGCAFDFRLDWMAVCAMGLALVAAYASDEFESPLGSACFGIAVGYALITRFLTGPYFVAIFLIFAGWLLRKPQRVRRLLHLVGSGLIATAVAGPIFWINWSTIYDYYLVGHFVGPESAIRSSHLGLLPSTLWVWDNTFYYHIGYAFFWIAGLALFAALVAMFMWPDRPDNPDFHPAPRLPSSAPALAFIAGPALVLILHVQKTTQVLGIMTPGLAMLAAVCIGRVSVATRRPARAALGAGVAAASLLFFVWQVVPSPHDPDFVQMARRASSVFEHIVRRSDQAHLEAPRVAVDRVTDCLDAQIMRVVCYERHRRWIPFVMTLPTGIGKEDPALYWERLRQSDFVFLTESGDPGGWPYDRQLAEMRPETLAWAEANLRRIDEIQLPGAKMVLFERRDLPAVP